MSETPPTPTPDEQPIETGPIDPSGELTALVRQAVLDALAAGGAQALAPARGTEGAPLGAPVLQMTTTPLLGLKQPGMDDPALITDLNDNFGILDNSITATQAVTLTNKTLDAPLINNPTIVGWTNAQHTHLDAAGGGGLDGAAIVSGYNGTGNLLRESAASFTDPLVRDTIQWGAKPSGAADTNLQRLTSGRLRLTGTVANSTAFYEARQGDAGTPSPTVARFGAPVAQSVTVAVNASCTADGAWHPDDVTKPARLFGATDTSFVWHDAVGAEPLVLRERMRLDANGSLVVSPVGQYHAFDGKYYSVGWGPTDAKWSTSYAAIDFPNAALYMNVASANAIELGMNTYVRADNQRVARVGTIPGGMIQLLANNLYFFQMAQVATDALQTPTLRLQVDANGTLNLSPSLNQRAIQAYGPVWTMPGTATSAFCAGDQITANYFALFSQGDVFYINSPAANRFSINNIGTVTINPDDGSSQIALMTPSGKNLVLGTQGGTSCIFAPSSGYVFAVTDNVFYMGHPTWRWAGGYFATPLTVGSHVDLKENIAPLDPAACARAVLDTDWLSYDYKPPALPERREDEDDGAWASRQEAHQRSLTETAPSRHQKGYVLGSPDYKVADLFGNADRENRSDGADIGVLGAALQQALGDLADARERITALEAAA